MVINGITLKQDGHYWVLSYNGKYVGDLFRTYHPTIPYEVYYKELDDDDWYNIKYIESQRCNTHEEATAWIRDQIAARQPVGTIVNIISAAMEFFGPWRQVKV